MVGLDVARCLALLGMVATHVFLPRGPDGDLALPQAIAGGRSAALFAVLAGVSLALMTGRRDPVTGRERVARSWGIVVRALLIALVGLYLGSLGSGLAIILTYYGLLFLLGLPFVGLRAPALLVLTGAWLVVAPVISQLVRPELPPRGFASPTFDQLADPGQLLSELLFTGYYPVVPWLAYLLAGMALGRLDLANRAVQGWITGAGAALALVSFAVSRILTGPYGIAEELAGSPGAPAATGPDLLQEIAGGMFGTTPTGGPWEWLLVVAPHSATPFDLAHTIGTSYLVIGACLLLLGAVPTARRRAVAIAFGAGTMTLTLYTLHVVMRTPAVLPDETPSSFPLHVVALLTIGGLYVYGGRRGPLEWVVAAVSGRAVERSRREAHTRG
ncbi:heparan-alpha-glucosaminide N-acetyltransferase domain-containing protein [Nocardioides sp.]|uniref:heparan-alpha-glucosaminide N-acetyltransferase domain-containing protein n=1 Tax=Nocardioides sp. TaxID=35761 RepID=UPI002D7E228D|nr:heparan-alpha-glucosaminide N-acetyltransferase domain-containing protein [Nocardioides sp.]HET8959284.1 heparan-alpha-glucosaminide N-acetyltransferase domain-containing protein [Nocardioides sp.]